MTTATMMMSLSPSYYLFCLKSLSMVADYFDFVGNTFLFVGVSVRPSVPMYLHKYDKYVRLFVCLLTF